MEHQVIRNRVYSITRIDFTEPYKKYTDLNTDDHALLLYHKFKNINQLYNNPITTKVTDKALTPKPHHGLKIFESTKKSNKNMTLRKPINLKNPNHDELYFNLKEIYQFKTNMKNPNRDVAKLRCDALVKSGDLVSGTPEYDSKFKNELDYLVLSNQEESTFEYEQQYTEFQTYRILLERRKKDNRSL